MGILRRNGRVSVHVVDNCKNETLMPIIKQVIKPNSIIYTDAFSTYDNIIKEGFAGHYVVNHNNNEFAKNTKIHTNGIENFCGLCKNRLAKFRGLNKNNFLIHIKECEFRYNHKHDNIYNLLLKNFRNKPLKLS